MVGPCRKTWDEKRRIKWEREKREFFSNFTPRKGKTKNKFKKQTYNNNNIIRNTLVKFSRIGIVKPHTINCYKTNCKKTEVQNKETLKIEKKRAFRIRS